MRVARRQYVFSVAQIVNLLYRRLVIGSALVEVRRSGQGAVLQDGILRYSRLAVCATRTTEGLTIYGSLLPLSRKESPQARGQGRRVRCRPHIQQRQQARKLAHSKR